MTTYIVPEDQVEQYYNNAIKNVEFLEEAKLQTTIMGFPSYELEEAKKEAKIGDCLLVEYEGNKLVPFQVLHKYEKDGELRCVLGSYYLLEKRAFDQNTNVWRDCELRRYLNGPEFAAKFNPEFYKCMKTHEVHTDDYVTNDKVWIPSHEEIGYVDSSSMFKKNVGAITFDYYKENPSEQTEDEDA